MTSSSVPITPATEGFGHAALAARPASATVNEPALGDEEVMRLKVQLAQAQNKITRLDRELASTRQGGPGLDQPVDSSPADIEFPRNPPGPIMSRIPGLHPISSNTQYVGREGGHPWSSYDDNQSDTSDALSATGFNRSRTIWGGMKQTPSVPASAGLPPLEMQQNGPWVGRTASHGYVDPGMSYESTAPGNFRPERLTPDFDLTAKPLSGRRGNRYDARFGSQGLGGAGQGYGGQPNYGGYTYHHGQYDSGAIASGSSQNAMGAGVYSSYHPTPIGTSLSPLASEFTSMSEHAGPWKSEVSLNPFT